MNIDLDVRLEHISVKKLFNRYNYELDFNDPVSIIIAPNGYGKTTIFHLINATLAADVTSLNYLRTIPFDEFTCTLSDDSRITLSRQFPSENDPANKLTRTIIELGINYYFRIDTRYSVKDNCISDKTIEYSLDYLTCSNKYGSAFIRNDNHFNRVDLFTQILSDLAGEQQRLLVSTKCYYPLFFISANRLILQKSSYIFKENTRAYSSRNYDSNYDSVNFLDLADRDIADKVRVMTKEYEQLKANAQNSLPSRFLQSKVNCMPDYEEFKIKWDDYINHLKEFHSLGFIDDDISSLYDISPNDYSGKAEFLNVYLDSFSSTITPLYIYYDSFRLLKDIIDSRNEITGKSISFTEDGVRFHIDGSELSIRLSSLSSGEKNDFIMFYNLLFKAKERGIVLIDEPEISLHIEWQEAFIDHLSNIVRKNKLQALVATHSPHIINGYFNLIREL